VGHVSVVRPRAERTQRDGGLVAPGERAHARPLARVGGRVGSGHGRKDDSPFAAGWRNQRAALKRYLRRGLAPVVVFDTLALLFICERDIEVGVKSLPNEDAQGKVQPIRALYACSIRATNDALLSGDIHLSST
jgi:hypothetical protein